MSNSQLYDSGHQITLFYRRNEDEPDPFEKKILQLFMSIRTTSITLLETLSMSFFHLSLAFTLLLLESL